MDENLRREIILENYNNPFHKKDLSEDELQNYIKINTNNESCIDDLDIFFEIENGVVKNAVFNGEACAISTSATSIMLRNIIGKTKEEVKEYIENYQNMINEMPYNEELLKDLNAYNKIYLQPNRKNCALLPKKAIERLMEKIENDN